MYCLEKEIWTHRKPVPFLLPRFPLQVWIWKVPRLRLPRGEDDVEDGLDGEDDDGDHPDQVPLVRVLIVGVGDLPRDGRRHEPGHRAHAVSQPQHRARQVRGNILQQFPIVIPISPSKTQIKLSSI